MFGECCTCVCVFLQHGKEYNDTPARKLSQSFCLDIVGGKAITPKQVWQHDVGHCVTVHIVFAKRIK